MPDHQPAPRDLEEVELPKGLVPLTERLAEHVHDMWSRQRLADGWTLGPERNDETRQHPCLVPYEDLPDEEKEYDRVTAINTLKAVIDLGFQIVAPEDLPPREARGGPDQRAGIEALLRSKKPVHTRELRKLWEDRMECFWARHPEWHEILADVLLKRSYPLWANEVLIEGLRCHPKSVRLRQLQALSLMRTGRPRLAREILEALIAEDEKNRTGETLGLLASSHKVSWSSAPEDSEKSESLGNCYEIYRSAFEQTGDYYPGINAAAMAVVRGEREDGRQIATRVQKICDGKVRAGDRSYWTLATLAEAALIEGDRHRAADLYGQAVETASSNIDSISATRRQALMLAEQLGIDDTDIRRALPVPLVAVFGGLPCWQDGKVFLPAIENEAAFRELARDEIRRSRLKIVYATGVGVGDLLFLETVLEEKGEINLVLPAPPEDLAQFSGSFGARGEAWSRQLDRVLAQASVITIVSRDLGSADPEVFSYTNRILAGASILRSKALGTSVHAIELTTPDGRAHGAFGNRGTFPGVFPLSIPGLNWGDPIPAPASGLTSEIKGILFADLKGYSKMPASEFPLYVTEFLEEAGKLCDSEPGIQCRNTWGDAFYLVFDTVSTAAHFGKRLRSFVKETNWLERGFSQNFGIRISLHAGPLFGFDDPVLHTITYSGTHASRAARIEPVTEEGQIFVSEPFACLAAEANAADPKFEYLGRRALAKEYGDEGLFMLL